MIAIGVAPARSRPITQTRPFVVRIETSSRTDLLRLARLGLDLLETREGTARFAYVTAEQYADLQQNGWKVSIDVRQSVLASNVTNANFFGYRSVEETEAFLRDVVARFPQLASLDDFGDSYDKLTPDGPAGYDLLGVRLSNRDTSGTKPVFFLMAAIHAREWTSAEVATRYISYLVEGYGKDADITWLLDEHTIVVVPIANPDGRKIAERGLLQRKNRNPTYGTACSEERVGVDLNRNHSLGWGTINAPDTPACSDVFPGGGPASEPETQALQAYIASFFPNPVRPIDGAPAPDTTSGVLISLHSYADLVLWPWGSSYDPAPNASALARLGGRMATFNGYQPQQAIDLYPTSGTTDEWAYGELGIAAYTFEIGPNSGECAGFMPLYRCLDEGNGGNFWGRNLPALRYAARVSAAPYTAPSGPDVSELTLTRNGDTVTIVGLLSSSGEPISGGEVYLGASAAWGGQAIALTPRDGAFDSDSEAFQVQIAAPAESAEDYLLFRGRSISGTWGPHYATWLASTVNMQASSWLPLVTR
jgi:hypothetical protein